MGDCLLYAGTEDGVFVLRADGGGRVATVGRGLEGNAVRAVAVHPDQPEVALVGCGLRGWGLHRTGDAGRLFEPAGFADRWVWGVSFAPGDPETVYVGTEPPMLWVSRDGGASFAPLDAIERLASRPDWRFGYAPFYAGHVHGLAIHPARPERLFAGVEEGALILSRDGGETWSDALVGRDVHRVAIDPADPDRVLAGLFDGLWESRDAGETWREMGEFRGRYVHGILFDPRGPGALWVDVAEEGSPLRRSGDGGATWHRAGAGLPAALSADTLCLHPTEPGALFYAGGPPDGANGVFTSRDAGDTWAPVGPELPRVWRLAATRRREEP